MFPAIPSQRGSVQEVSFRYDSALGMGTMRLRLRNPTAFSTLPFSHPLAGLRNPASTRQCPTNRRNTSTTVILSHATRCAAPVALSNTSTRGARPICR